MDSDTVLLLLLLLLLLQVMMAVGACSALGSPVIGCYMNPDKRFAFVEFRSVEEASNAMAFDGVTCQVRGLD
jgi:splicing factor U2AF subunit